MECKGVTKREGGIENDDAQKDQRGKEDVGVGCR